ncbi:hypothetical protein AAF712_004526 [Marasmius tenuissimus]|uniref:Importin N-terminal domain-containing protein n=1 Tax=Marasmius tenuissimus TaxID=585030 RepID=A0ABR3A627_9AGAR
MTSHSTIAECLSSTLNSDPNVRMAAELKLAELLSSPETGLALSQLVVTQDADISLRQMSIFAFFERKARVLMDFFGLYSASIVLRKYVRERWSPYFSTFKGNAPSVETKGQIRQAVFHGLSDPSSKIRSSCAHTISSIANCDWPDEYPDLLTSLINLISSNSTNSVHGAMQVFTEFINNDLTEDQILPVLRDLLPVLLNILGSTETQTPLTRSRSIAVFRQCVISLYMVKEQHPQAVKEAIASVLPVWLEAFKVLLNIDPKQDLANGSNWEGLAVRNQVLKALDTIHTSFPRAIMPYLPELLASALNHLVTLYPTFDEYYLAATEAVPQSSEDEPVSLPQLVTSTMDFIASIARGGRARDWFTGERYATLISAVFQYIQMTDEDEDTWANNANAFVAQEDDDLVNYSVRVAGLDLLTVLMDRNTAQATSICHNVIQQTAASSEQARNAGKKDWWRPLEAALAAIGSQAETIQECIEDEEESGRSKPIDIESLLSNVIPSILGQSDFPFLQGRGFVFASQYAKLLPVQLAGQYLEAAVHVVEANDAGIPIKVSAVKAVHNFCLGSDDSALTPFVPRIAKDLGPFLLATSEDTLSLVLETLAVVLDVDEGKWMTADLATSLVVATLEVWSKNNKDPIFLSIFPDIINSLAGSKAAGIYEVVVKQALPPLCMAISNATQDQSYIASSAIDLVGSLVRAAPEGNLGDGFFALLAPSLFKCLGDAEDRDVLQNGITCLTLIIRKDVSQLLNWRESGSSGLDYVLRLVAKILQAEDESAGLTIGELIIHLLRRAGESVLPVLPELLQAMVGRMQSAKTATFIQSLVIPFAFLINNQRDTVLSLLEEMTIQPSGRTGLDILIQTWCENAETFQGFWQSRSSTMALTQLFVSERQSLRGLMVKGDLIVKPETKNVPTEFTSIPFPVKAIKIILHEVQSGGEAATMGASQDDAQDLDSDDGDEDWTDTGDSATRRDTELEFLSELIGPKGMAFDNDDILDVSDDEDLKDDPVSKVDMQAHLLTFLKECAARNTNSFSEVADQLNAVVSNLVRASMGTSVSSSVTDEDLDRHVRDLLIKDAKKRAEKYGEQGIKAYLRSGMSETNAPKTNKRFLSSIIRSTDDHNRTVLRAQALAAEEVKRERRETEKEERKRRAEEAVEAERSRKRRSTRRERDEDGWDRWDGRTADRKGKRKERDWENWNGEDEDGQEDRRRSSRRHHRSRSRSEERDRHKRSARRSSRSRTPERHSFRRSHRRHRSRSKQSRKKEKRYALSSDSESDEERSDRHRRRRRSRSRSRSSDSPSRSTRPHSSSAATPNPSSSEREVESSRLIRSSREKDKETDREKDREDGKTAKSRKGRSRSRTPDSRSQSKVGERDSKKPRTARSRSRSQSRLPASHSRNGRRTQSTLSDENDDRMSISRSPSPGPDPLPKLPSKMDRYFEESYDPRLDVAPLTAPKVPATGLINNAEYEGWDAMLDFLRQRKEDKAEKKRLERMGLSKDEIKKTLFGTGESSSSSSSGVKDRWNGEGSSIMDIQYKKRGSVREWDMGKEGF